MKQQKFIEKRLIMPVKRLFKSIRQGFYWFFRGFNDRNYDQYYFWSIMLYKVEDMCFFFSDRGVCFQTDSTRKQTLARLLKLRRAIKKIRADEWDEKFYEKIKSEFPTKLIGIPSGFCMVTSNSDTPAKKKKYNAMIKKHYATAERLRKQTLAEIFSIMEHYQEWWN